MPLHTFKKLRNKLFKLKYYLLSAVIFFGSVYILALSLIYLSESHWQQSYISKVNEVLGNRLNHPTQISTLHVRQQGLMPALALYEVTIFDQQKTKALLRIKELDISIAWLQSLWHWRLIPDAIRIKGLTLSFKIDAEGNWHNKELSAEEHPKIVANEANGTNIKWDEQLKTLLSYRKIILHDFAINIETATGITWNVDNIALKISRHFSQHKLSLKADLEQKAVPAAIAAHLNFAGDLTAETVPNIAGTIVISDLDLAANLPVNKPLTSAVNWQNFKLALIKILPPQGNVKLVFRRIHLPSLAWFKNIIFIDNFNTHLQWQFPDKSTTLKAQLKNTQLDLTGISFNGDAAISLPVNGDSASGKVSAKFNFASDNLSQLKQYYPAAIMPPKLIAWMENAFPNEGSIAGNIIINENFDQFSFADQSSNAIQVTSKLNNITLKYHPQWPEITNIDGTLNFTGKKLQILAQTAEISDVSLENIHATIEDIKNPHLIIDGQVATTGKDAQEFVASSPLLHTAIGRELANLIVQGAVNVQLNLQKLLLKPQPLEVTGHVNFQNDNLIIPLLHLEIQKIIGGLDFTNRAISAPSLSGTLFGRSFNFSIKPLQSSGANTATLVTFSSTISAALLNNYFSLPFNLEHYITGDTAYSGFLKLPYAAENNATLSISSPLRGINIAIPWLSFTKDASLEQNFKIQLDWPRNFGQLKVFMRYNRLLSAALAFTKVGTEHKFTSGQINFNSGDATIPTAQGLAIVGSFANLDIAKWQKSLEQAQAAVTSEMQETLGAIKKTVEEAKTDIHQVIRKTPNSAETQKVLVHLISKIDLRIGKFYLWNQVFSPLHLVAIPKNSSWQILLENSNIKGTVAFDYLKPNFGLDREQSLITANFQSLYLQPAKSTSSTADPQTFPEFKIQVDDFRYGDKNYGRLAIHAIPSTNGMTISAFEINNPDFQMTAAGKWRRIEKTINTSLKGSASSKDVGAMLKNLKFGESLVGGVGQANFALTWRGAFYAPNLDSLYGNVIMAIKNGRIINLGSKAETEMGIGRLFSILGLQTLPRRLTFDFSDLVQSGFSFDTLQGDFKITAGDAFTNNTKMTGPVAQIEARGNIGFSQKDYDLELAVMPNVTSSLPVIATVAGGPVVGAATWLADKLLGKEVSRAIKHVYKIQGSWANPEIKAL